LTGRPDRSAWTDEPGKDRNDGTDGGVKTAMDNVVWAGQLGIEQLDRTAGNRTDGYGSGLLDRTSGTRQLGHDS
jgi:hypothetical protein